MKGYKMPPRSEEHRRKSDKHIDFISPYQSKSVLC